MSGKPFKPFIYTFIHKVFISHIIKCKQFVICIHPFLPSVCMFSLCLCRHLEEKACQISQDVTIHSARVSILNTVQRQFINLPLFVVYLDLLKCIINQCMCDDLVLKSK